MYREKMVQAIIIALFVLLFAIFAPFLTGERKKTTGHDELNVENRIETREIQREPIQETQQVEHKKNTPENTYEKMYNNALSLYKNRDYDNALQLFQEAQKINPNPLVTYYTAMCHSKTEKYMTAEKEFASIEQNYKDSVAYWQTRAKNANLMKSNTALTYINKAERIAPNNLQVMHQSIIIKKNLQPNLSKNDLIYMFERLKREADKQNNSYYSRAAEVELNDLNKELEIQHSMQKDGQNPTIEEIPDSELNNLNHIPVMQ